ncbi:helix-turn-helix domain-containing protein [Amorphus orientalis]|uniref:Transcriptional regulator with XRE-family HTH domain n=1 Tax=Amorphus orientalis TaxID=649198 RepID=A0AAE3VKH3_9HYPH|nr:helix-turn-helix transcriptional regulator [Amorphus orientalis]MDQ0314079.1 transcriptional regulator with XRE-family HTH domain [Amorphus orientalis]
MTDLKTKEIDEAFEMGPEEFRAWRKSLGLKQKEAADRLGLKKRMIQYYEKGNRDGKAVKIPKTVRLACYALSHRILDFDGKRVSSGPVVPGDGPVILQAIEGGAGEAEAPAAE